MLTWRDITDHRYLGPWLCFRSRQQLTGRQGQKQPMVSSCWCGAQAERRSSRWDVRVNEGSGQRMRNGRWTKGGQIGHGDSWNRLSNLWVVAENEPVRRFLYQRGYQVDQLAGSLAIKRDGRAWSWKKGWNSLMLRPDWRVVAYISTCLACSWIQICRKENA